MMSADWALRVNTQLVACEIVDSEAVIINLSNGMYYTMDAVGAEVWRMIEEGRTQQSIAGALASRYSVSFDDALADLERIAQELLQEELVVIDEGGGADVSQAAANDPPAAAGPYSKPTLVRYSDMSEVLALDPPLPELDISLRPKT